MKNELLGYQLKRSVFNRVGTLLIAKDSILSTELLQLLDNHRIDLDPADTIKIDNKTLISSAAAEIRDLFSGIRDSGNFPIEEVSARILPSISTVAETPDLFDILANMQSKDDYTYRRNVGVAVFSYMIGRWLHMNGKIVAVADTFHALSTQRVYRPAVPFYEVIQMMREESFGKLNSHICRLFIQRMMELTVGNIVTLTNGKKAKVILIHPAAPERPLVAVGNTFIDLSLNRNIQIKALSGAR